MGGPRPPGNGATEPEEPATRRPIEILGDLRYASSADFFDRVRRGSGEVTRNLMAGFYARELVRPGDPLEVRGERRALKAITSIQVLLERERETISGIEQLVDG